MNKLVARILKQCNIPRMGAFVDVMYFTLPMFGIVGQINVIIILYATVRPYLVATVPWMTLWLFIGLMAGSGMVLMLVMFKFFYPSYYTFRNKQEYTHANLLREDLQKIADRLERIEKSMGIDNGK